MNVFVDYHHGDLYHSLHLLFEKRLGWNLFRPVGTEWATRGFWKYSQQTDTINQYLGLHQVKEQEKNYCLCPDVNHKTVHKALTFEQFMNTNIDIIIASVANHELSFYTLQKRYKPYAKLIRQCGNVEAVDFRFYKNIMVSTKSYQVPGDVNAVFYHQEFDTSIFFFIPEVKSRQITNLMNCLPDSIDFPLWVLYKNELSDFDFKMYGILGKDGILSGLKTIALEIQASKFIWHVKAQGDGFGHIIHNAYACGRPCIVKGSYYVDKLAGELFEDQVTCIDLDKGSVSENLRVIRNWAKPDRHKVMCERAYERFKQVVNFDDEFEEIKKFLERLI
jgi:hypothetical protein